jgi:hypothetical protein
MSGLVIIGYMLLTNLCRLEGEAPVDCRTLAPRSMGSSMVCNAAMAQILETFPNMQPEALGYAAGTRLHVNLKCVPLFGEFSA